MTTVVGVLCRDGVVIGTDSSTTLTKGQHPTVEQPSDKLYQYGNVIVAGTGQVGLGQRFCSIVKLKWDSNEFVTPPMEIAKELCASAQNDWAETRVRIGQYAALVAYPSKLTPCLCEFAEEDFQPELKDNSIWYASLGSAQLITDPFLAFIREVFWKDGLPSVQEAIFAVTWTIEHAISINPGGVNGPLKIAVLEKGKKGALAARILDAEEVDIHSQNVEAAKQHLRAFRDIHRATGGNVPDVPRVNG